MLRLKEIEIIVAASLDSPALLIVNLEDGVFKYFQRTLRTGTADCRLHLAITH
ncbi:hypothetical protein KIN20_014641 [Parelaphostrongylus tenuis]|uniref:Uncharacterized protein n=1 Tax=Parelaphostrongylus tenuis TaxID=148309 RepID=A0AAD5QPF9_PARTN|nr:hypothetical protein KIN20_014641 [Parelaphostrongylus tenuis]